MKKDVIISIRSVQQGEGDPEVMEFVTEGRLYDHKDSLFLRYRESELTGMRGTTTVLRIDPEPRLTLTRSGTVTAQMTFEKDKRNVSAYAVPEGVLNVGVRAFELESSLGSSGGTIRLGYTVELDAQPAATHSLEMQVREKKITKRISEKIEQ